MRTRRGAVYLNPAAHLHCVPVAATHDQELIDATPGEKRPVLLASGGSELSSGAHPEVSQSLSIGARSVRQFLRIRAICPAALEHGANSPKKAEELPDAKSLRSRDASAAALGRGGGDAPKWQMVRSAWHSVRRAFLPARRGFSCYRTATGGVSKKADEVEAPDR